MSPRVVSCYVAVGDSFTAGTPDEAGGTWSDQLAGSLAKVNPALRYRNLAFSGARCEQLKAQLEQALALQPDLVTLTCGANDVLESLRPDLDAVAADLDDAIGRLRSALPDAILATATYPDVTRFRPFHPRSRARIVAGLVAVNDAIRTVAAAHDVAVLDAAEDPRANVREYFADDGYHCSPVGHRQAAAAFRLLLSRQFSIALPDGALSDGMLPGGRSIVGSS